MHVYERDPRSNVGNCRCGYAWHSRLHPHPFTPAMVDELMCVCASFDPSALVHACFERYAKEPETDR